MMVWLEKGVVPFTAPSIYTEAPDGILSMVRVPVVACTTDSPVADTLNIKKRARVSTRIRIFLSFPVKKNRPDL
jgi:hypothetical protein